MFLLHQTSERKALYRVEVFRSIHRHLGHGYGSPQYFSIERLKSRLGSVFSGILLQKYHGVEWVKLYCSFYIFRRRRLNRHSFQGVKRG